MIETAIFSFGQSSKTVSAPEPQMFMDGKPFASYNEADKLDFALSNLIGPNYKGKFGAVEKNVSQAVKIYRYLSENGSASTKVSADFSLSRIYLFGLDGTGENLEKGFEWMIKAGEVLLNTPYLLTNEHMMTFIDIGEIYEFGRLNSNYESDKTHKDLKKALICYKKVLLINNIEKYYCNDYVPPMLIEDENDEKINRIGLHKITNDVELRIKRVQTEINK